MDANNATPNTPSLTSIEVEARITTERNRLLDEQRLESELLQQRLAPLEAGEDEALDRIESQINQSRDRQLRIQERIELLQKRAEAAREHEQEASLDHLSRVALAARVRAEGLIRDDYARLASELAEVLRQLEIADKVVDRANTVLRSAGRPLVASSNGIRCRQGRRIVEHELRKVGPNDSQHPQFGNIVRRSTNSDFVYLKDGTTAPAFVEVLVETERTLPADRPEAVYDEVVLPGVGPAPENQSVTPLWRNDSYRRNPVTASEVDLLIKEIENSFAAASQVAETGASPSGETTTGTLATVGRAVARTFGKVVGGGES